MIAVFCHLFYICCWQVLLDKVSLRWTRLSLYVAGIQYKIERAWILSMIADGLREHLDYKICEKRFAVKILLTFYDSPLADNQTQVTVLRSPSLESSRVVLTLSSPVVSNGYTSESSVPYWSNPPLLIFWHSGTLALRTECQSAWMSKN